MLYFGRLPALFAEERPISGACGLLCGSARSESPAFFSSLLLDCARASFRAGPASEFFCSKMSYASATSIEDSKKVVLVAKNLNQGRVSWKVVLDAESSELRTFFSIVPCKSPNDGLFSGK